MATVRITVEADVQAQQLPKVMAERLKKLLVRLAEWPNVSGAKPLTGELAGRFRIRFGDYRLVFRVEGETVTVIKVGHRKDVYG